MWYQVAMFVIGCSLGIVVAGATLALLIALGIVVRYARITKTKQHIRCYENFASLGLLTGALWHLSEWSIPLGICGLIVYGFCSGFFLGGWIVALGEVINVFAIFFRRVQVKKGTSLVFATMALGKTLGVLLYYGKGWWLP